MAKTLPLEVRPGARFTCAGDGLCCTDVHLLGPVTRAEKRSLALLGYPDAVVRMDAELALATTDEGHCVFLEGGAHCRLHAEQGADSKPRSCRRFPFHVVATPDARRVGTDHRCPCRSLGQRPALSAQSARPSVVDARDRVIVDRRVEGEIAITDEHSEPWSAWRQREAALLARLAEGHDALDVLDAEPFPELEAAHWPGIGEILAEGSGVARWSRAHQWVGDAIVSRGGAGFPSEPRSRPWRDAFDRAQARGGDANASESAMASAVENDWVADVIWSLEWCERGSFSRARSELATRVAIARLIASRLRELGARADRAMAEAIASVEVTGLSEIWDLVVSRIRVDARA